MPDSQISQIAAYPVHALPIGLGSPGQGVGRHMACLRRIKNQIADFNPGLRPFLEMTDVGL